MSNKEERKAPVLRFKGFTDDWEQRKFTELGKLYYGKSAPKWSVVEKGGTPCIRYGELYTKYSSKIDNVYSHTSIDKSKLKFSTGNELLIPRVGEEPLDFAKHTSWLSIPNVAIGEMITVLKTKENPLFLANYLRAKYVFKFARLVEGGNVSNLYFERYEDTNILIPSKNEQQNISKLILKIDKLITLQQRKLSLIEKLRENISEHIFSPDIMKFKNIDPEFEIKKLSDISNIFIGLVTTMTKNYAKNGILLIRNSNIKENNFKFDNYIYLDSKFAEKNKNREMKIGDVVTVHTGDIGTSAVIEPKEENSIGFATITTRPNNKTINSYYLSDYLNTKKHKNWAVRMSTGDGRRNYNLKDFTRIRLNVPSLNYQIKIVALIKYLESFSKSEKKKINQLNSLKQFLLQNLFI